MAYKRYQRHLKGYEVSYVVDRLPAGANGDLSAYLIPMEGALPVELRAGVAKLVVARFKRTLFCRRVAEIFSYAVSYELVGSFLDKSPHLRITGGWLIPMALAGIGIMVWSFMMTQYLEDTLDSFGSNILWRSDKNFTFTKLLALHGAECELGVKLRGELALVRGGLGLNENGYKIICSLAAEWGGSFGDLLRTAVSLSQ